MFEAAENICLNTFISSDEYDKDMWLENITKIKESPYIANRWESVYRYY